MTAVLCPSCDAEWLAGPAVVIHEDDCPRLPALRAPDHECQAAAVGFCGHPDHKATP